MDVVDPSTRSKMMSSIKAKNTTPELTVRKWLHARGFRYSLHAKGLPGKPDLVLKKWNTAIFVHGCFWHRHCNCHLASTPKSRVEFWNEKFGKNVMRDRNNYTSLLDKGWRVAVVWECGLRKDHWEYTLPALKKWIESGDNWFESDSPP